MSKIQIESSSCSSTATHRITQPSSTLNRRYVHRPMTIAIEEAARTANQSTHRPVEPAIPSRLVNLGVRAADLEAAKKREQAEAARVAAAKAAEEAKKQAEQETESNLMANPVTLIPNVVEFGRSADGNNTEMSATSILAPTVNNMTNSITSVSSMPTNSLEPSMSATNSTMIPQSMDQVNQMVPAMPTTTEMTMSMNTSPTMAAPEIDTTALAMNIAADYATASLSASIKEYGDGYQSYAVAAPNNTEQNTPIVNDSVDAIAQAASEAIASIRSATAPDQVSEQIASLQAFANNIKEHHDTPEMRELGDTINKFIGIAKKSTKVQEESQAKSAKVALSPKANRAAAKVAKSSAKVMAASSRNRAKVSNAKLSASRPVGNASAQMSRMPARKLSAAEVRTKAMEQALHNVATMDEPKARAKRSRSAMRPRKKTGFKRFAIAFTCAAACVGGLIAFVGSNMPDISVRVAAMQTGIQAAYPSYVPRDYALGDIFSEDGKITMIFEGPAEASFTLVEEKSSWDSSALLRNYVEPKWGEEYVTTHEQGITIYISNANSDAAWVNGGVLYKITSSGTALTKKQVRSIVTSL